MRFSVPLCAGLVPPGKDRIRTGVPCMDQTVEFTGFGATTAILHTILWMDSTDPAREALTP